MPDTIGGRRRCTPEIVNAAGDTINCCGTGDPPPPPPPWCHTPPCDPPLPPVTVGNCATRCAPKPLEGSILLTLSGWGFADPCGKPAGNGCQQTAPDCCKGVVGVWQLRLTGCKAWSWRGEVIFEQLLCNIPTASGAVIPSYARIAIRGILVQCNVNPSGGGNSWSVYVCSLTPDDDHDGLNGCLGWYLRPGPNCCDGPQGMSGRAVVVPNKDAMPCQSGQGTITLS